MSATVKAAGVFHGLSERHGIPREQAEEEVAKSVLGARATEKDEKTLVQYTNFIV